MDERIKALRDDLKSGASEIVVKAAHILLDTPTKEIAEALQKTHPDMAPLFNLCQLFLKHADPRQPIKKFLTQIEQAPQA